MSFSLQLTDTLNGILPIAPTDESLLNHNREEDLQNRKNLVGVLVARNITCEEVLLVSVSLRS